MLKQHREPVKSLNTRVDLVMKATSYLGMGDYGDMMIGDKAIEFYDDGDPSKFIQIPWTEVDSIVASVMFKGHWIPRWGVQTKKNGMYKFSTRHTKKMLREIRKHMDPNRMVRSLTFFQVMRRNLKALGQRIIALFHKNKQKD
ncbi:DUF956 family protein [Lactobacillus selangorensis]|uniref:DUF956 family protein n=1 Tax=Lactobacillus selangorensis TaxID=81857 RepID=UPI003083FA16